MSHRQPSLSKILDMLNDRFRYKPDFLALRGTHGVIAEVGTVRGCRDKVREIRMKLENLKVLSFASSREFPYGPPTWHPADYRPSEGPVVIPIGKYQVCTWPTWPEKRGLPALEPGVLIYEVHQRAQKQYEPVRVPALSPSQKRQLESAVQSLRLAPHLAELQLRNFVRGLPSLEEILRSRVFLYGAVGAMAIAAALLVVLTPGLPDEALIALLAARLLPMAGVVQGR